LIHSELGYVEQDPEQIWHSVLRVIAESVLYASQNGNSIEALALSNQRETATAWDAEPGAPISNAISWQCPRSAEICRRLASHAELIRTRTGLPLATLISAGKWAWLMENDSNIQALSEFGALRLGTVDSWLVHKLTGGAVHATDFSNASRTGLLNLESLTWDDDLLDLFGLPAACDAGTAIFLGIVRGMLWCSWPRWRPDSGGDWRFTCRNVWSRAIHSRDGEGNVRDGFVTHGIDAEPACGHTSSGANHCLVDWRQNAIRPRRKYRYDRLSSAMGGGVPLSPRSGA